MKHAALVRRQLGVRTVMNLLGPCINPARPPVQLLGVADPKMLRRIAQTLAAMGVKEALVVHGSGLDEIALHGETRAIRLSGDEIEELEITPEEAGLERAPLKVVTGGDVDENAARLKACSTAGGGSRGRHRHPQHRGAAAHRRTCREPQGRRHACSRCAGIGRRGESPRPTLSRQAVAEPVGVLGRIAAAKQGELARRLDGVSLDALRDKATPTTRSLTETIAQPGARFILEIKKASPSAGAIRPGADPAAVARGYAGVADALSVLCDHEFFGGSLDDLAAARAEFDGPILAKDFFIDPRQVAEARIAGADAILVMLSLLDDEAAREMIAEARRFGMDALVEVHDEAEMQPRARARSAADRHQQPRLARPEHRPRDHRAARPLRARPHPCLRIGHRHARRRRTAVPLVDGFLVGSSLMQANEPAQAARHLIFGRTKSCGLNCGADIGAARPAAFAGFVFVTVSPRHVTVAEAAPLAGVARSQGTLPVGVFRDSLIDDVADIAASLNLHAVQLHGEEDEEYVDSLRYQLPEACEIWTAVSVGHGPLVRSRRRPPALRQ